MSPTIDIRGLEEAIAALDPEVAKKAAVRTINDLTAKGRTRASTKIRTIYNVKAASLKARMKVTKLVYNAPGKASITTTGSRFNLFDFSGTRELAAGGISAQIRKDRPRTKFRWAFVGRSLQGLQGFSTSATEGTARAYERRWRSERAREPSTSSLTRTAPWPRLPRRYRLPVSPLTTIGAADMFDIDPVYGDIQDLVDTDWESGFRRNYAFYAEKAGV